MSGGIRDTRLMAKAIMQRWDLTPEQRKQCLERLTEIVTSKAASPREATQAFRAILEAEKQNQADQHGRKPGPTVNIGVQFAPGSDEARAEIREIAERVRARTISGPAPE